MLIPTFGPAIVIVGAVVYPLPLETIVKFVTEPFSTVATTCAGIPQDVGGSLTVTTG